ncbi:MAG TPA: carboxypeptidase regulatory-like domain-containing protein [Gemmatimonadales bacterium]|nr:carboxypeptidase regulatory-like domain-containing protein [Gemmatimonadales bacterium]
MSSDVLDWIPTTLRQPVRHAMAAGLVLGCLLSGCGKDDGVASVLLVARVDVDPPGGDVTVGETLQLEAVPKTAGGIVLPANDVVWSSADQSIARVSSDGLVTAVSVGGPVQVRATISGVTGQVPVMVVPLPIDHVIVTPGTNDIVVGQAVPLTATAYDAANVVLSGRTFAWSSSDPSVAGVTTTGMVIGATEGGPVTISASSAGKSGSAIVTVTRRPPSRVGFLQQPGPSIAGLPLTPAIRVAIQDDLTGTVTTATNPVTISLLGNPTGTTLAGTLTVPAVNGVATFSNLVISAAGSGYSLLAASPGLSSAISGPFTVAAGSANQLGFVTAPPGGARSGVALSPAPVVQIRDGSGNPVAQAGVVITASLASGAGSMQGTATVTTGANGSASFTHLSINGLVGTYTIAFSAPGVAPVTSGPIVLSAGNPAVLAIVTQPSATAQSGVAFPSQPTLRLLDAAGNQVPQAGTAVAATISAGPAGGALGGATIVTTAADGSAAFAGLSLSGPSGSYVLAFGSSGLPIVTSTPIALSAGAGAALGITTQPSATVPNGASFPVQPVVQLRDAANNPVAQAGVSVTATILSGGGALGGTTTVATDPTGAAVFSNLSITGTIGSRTLLFAAGGYVSVASTSISITAGSATGLLITTQPPASAVSGIGFSPQPVVTLRDVSGNAVSQSGVQITASLASGPSGGSIMGTATVATDGSGAAHYSGLGLNGPSGTYTVGFGASGLATATSGPISLQANTAVLLAITTQPSTAVTSGTVFPQQPVIQLVDALNNPISQAGVAVTVALAGGNGTLGGTLIVSTDGTGQAAFAGLSITGTAGTYTLGFSSPGATGITSNPMTLGAGTPARLVIVTQPSSAAQSGAVFAQQPSVQMVDAAANPVSQGGTTVTVAIGTGGGTLGGTLTATTSAAGVATFTNLSITGSAGPRTLDFSSAGLTGVTSTTIDISSAPPAALGIATQPPVTAQSGSALVPGPVIQLQDGTGGSVAQAGVAITVALGSGSATLGGTLTVTSDAAGSATFSDLSITGLVGNYTLAFSSSGLTGISSGTIALTAGTATALTITTQPSSSVQDTKRFPQQPVIQLRDAVGNAVPLAGIPVTAAINAGGIGTGTLGGTLTMPTDATGAAIFTNLKITGRGTYSLKFTSPNLTPVVSNLILVF